MRILCVSNGDLDLHTRLDADGGDLLDDLRWAVQIDQTLVDPHLVAIPGLGTLTTGSLSCGDTEGLGWHTDRSLHLQVLVFSTLDQVSAHWNITRKNW